MRTVVGDTALGLARGRANLIAAKMGHSAEKISEPRLLPATLAALAEAERVHQKLLREGRAGGRRAPGAAARGNRPCKAPCR